MSHDAEDPSRTPPRPRPTCEIAERGECPFEERLTRQDRALARIEMLLRGDDRSPTPSGLLIRVDRIEQRMKLVWAAFAAAVGALCLFAWQAITEGRQPPKP